MAANDSNVLMDPEIDYLHPEVLPAETLIKILDERMIQDRIELRSMSKCQLVEIFVKYILPLPQRIYGDGRREKRLTENRSAKERRKRKAEDLGNAEKGPKVMKSTDSTPATDRIKPPPANDKKVIKLNTQGASHRNHEDTKNWHQNVNNKQHDDPVPTKKMKHQLITWP